MKSDKFCASEIAEKSANRFSTLLGGFLALVMIISAIVISILISVDRAETFAKGVTGYFGQMIVFGDYIEISRHISTSKKTGVILNAWIFDEEKNRVIVKSSDGSDTPEIEQGRRGQFLVTASGPVYISKYVVDTGASNRKLSLFTITSISLVPVAIALSGALIIGFLVSFVLRRFAHRISALLVDPISDLSSYFSNIRDTRSLVALSENSLGFREMELFYREFLHLWDRIKVYEQEEKSAIVNKSIAQMTQMFAHDVRKPFSLFGMTLERLKNADSPQEMRLVLSEVLPEVERSLVTVNGLISDVLNVGGEFNLVLKPVRLAPIVEDVVSELRKLYPHRELVLRIEVPDDVWVQADDTRLQRVFLNILSNAVEAVHRGVVQLWISSLQVQAERVEIRVGNSGSYIDDDACKKLFDLFYTSGKKGGTGLGLAIVKKIISGHGSDVVCVSEKTEKCPEGRVEFVWSFARAAAQTSTVQLLQPERSLSPSSSEALKPNVVFLDDSPLARWVWEAKLRDRVSLQCFVGPRDFLLAVDSGCLALKSLHTVITDYFFATDEKLTGVELAKELRDRGFHGRILLASNGEFDAQVLAGIVNKVVDKNPVDWDSL
ncbi:MAG: hypothetical protein RL189_2028 [Pseudomonadota bacterium]|jgi:signal transduction histidine kinase